MIHKIEELIAKDRKTVGAISADIEDRFHTEFSDKVLAMDYNMYCDFVTYFDDPIDRIMAANLVYKIQVYKQEMAKENRERMERGRQRRTQKSWAEFQDSVHRLQDSCTVNNQKDPKWVAYWEFNKEYLGFKTRKAKMRENSNIVTRA